MHNFDLQTESNLGTECYRQEDRLLMSRGPIVIPRGSAVTRSHVKADNATPNRYVRITVN